MTAGSERSLTIRQAIRAALEDGPHTARELSERVRVAERDIVDHLAHLARDREHGVEIVPASCLACEFVFEDRRRTSRPGRCPRCRSPRIAPPAFRLRS